MTCAIREAYIREADPHLTNSIQARLKNTTPPKKVDSRWLCGPPFSREMAYSLPLSRVISAERASHVPFAGRAATGRNTSCMTTTHDTTEIGSSSTVQRAGRSGYVQYRAQGIGRRTFGYRPSTGSNRRATPPTSSTSNQIGGVYENRQFSRSLFSYLEADTPPVTLDVLDVDILPLRNKEYRRSIGSPYVQYPHPGYWTWADLSGRVAR